MMKPLHAKRKPVPPHRFFAQHEIDLGKVAAMVRHIRQGKSLPVPVVIQYGDRFMPIDGHHRLSAYQELGLSTEAWCVPGSRFETLDQLCRLEGDGKRAEDFVLCDGIPALKVAESP
jgi:hypothetical protein